MRAMFPRGRRSRTGCLRDLVYVQHLDVVFWRESDAGPHASARARMALCSLVTWTAWKTHFEEKLARTKVACFLHRSNAVLLPQHVSQAWSPPLVSSGGELFLQCFEH